MSPRPKDPSATGRASSPVAPNEPASTPAPGKGAAPKKKRFQAWIPMVIIATIVAGIWSWKAYFEDRFIAKRFATVVEGKLYRSGQINAVLIEDVLTDNNIKVVVDLTGMGDGGKDEQAELAVCEKLGVQRFDGRQFAMPGDGRGDIRKYARAIAAIVEANKAGKAVLVHCAAGSQRAGGVIACYRMLVEGKSGADAYEEMLSYGVKMPKDQRLIDHINQNMFQLAPLLVENGAIKQVPKPLPKLGPG